MTKKYLTVTVFALITMFSVSCSKSSNETTSSESSSTTTQSPTWVKLTVLNSSNAPKANYIVMMFDQPPSTTSALPPIKKQVTTDANGLAYFDLNSMVTSSANTTYYFEAFVPSGNDFIWKSITHPHFEISKGNMVTSSILVND